ncbi:hypothetical protein LXL04_027151 [Taraxacum kok-saghyz]
MRKRHLYSLTQSKTGASIGSSKFSFLFETADVWTTSSSAELCRGGPQTADILTLKKQTEPNSLCEPIMYLQKNLDVYDTPLNNQTNVAVAPLEINAFQLSRSLNSLEIASDLSGLVPERLALRLCPDSSFDLSGLVPERLPQLGSVDLQCDCSRRPGRRIRTMGIRNHEEEQWTRVNHRKKQTGDRNGSHGGQSQHAVHVVKPKSKMPIMKYLVEKRNGEGFSYASVVSGNLKPHSQPKEKVEEVVLELMSGDFVVTNRLTACYGKARDFPTLPNLKLLCMDEGFDEVELRYVGGLWVLFEFQSEEMCRNFMMNEAMDHWLSEKKTWDRNFVPTYRIVWLEIEGLPIRAWSKSAFRQIVAKWGVVLHLDDDLGEDVYKNQVCVLTTHHHIISEALKIRVDGQMFVVRVKEAPGWSPTFAKGDPKQETQNMEDDKVCEDELQEDLNADNEEEEEHSEDPFGIYKTMEKMKEVEIKNEEPVGFHAWPRSTAVDVVAQNLNSPDGGCCHQQNPMSSPPSHRPSPLPAHQETQQIPTPTPAPEAQQIPFGSPWGGKNASRNGSDTVQVAPTAPDLGRPPTEPNGRVHEAYVSSASMSHAPGFTNFQCNSGGNRTSSQMSVTYGGDSEECQKTMEMGATVGIDMTKFLHRRGRAAATYAIWEASSSYFRGSPHTTCIRCTECECGCLFAWPESSIRSRSDVTLAGRAKPGESRHCGVYVTLAKTGLRLHRTYLDSSGGTRGVWWILMNCLSINIQGAGNLDKRQWVRKLCNKYKVNFLGIQETKTVTVDDFLVRSIWGNPHFLYEALPPRGLSGGIWIIWNPDVIKKTRVLFFDWYVVLEATWINTGKPVTFITVYAPQDNREKRMLWSSLLQTLEGSSCDCVIMGDFNEVRDENERLGSQFLPGPTRVFNQFIEEAGLVDVSLGGPRFTWCDRWASKFSKLDRFLVTGGFADSFPRVSGMVLEKKIPDHRPILLMEHVVDYGPLPFRLYHSWMGMDGFDEIVREVWSTPSDGSQNPWVVFKKKLQTLKSRLKDWNTIGREQRDRKKIALREEVEGLEAELMEGEGNVESRQRRINAIKELRDIDHVEHTDLAQKAKIRWGVEGDENLGFFHGVINRKRRQTAMIMCEID